MPLESIATQPGEKTDSAIASTSFAREPTSRGAGNGFKDHVRLHFDARAVHVRGVFAMNDLAGHRAMMKHGAFHRGRADVDAKQLHMAYVP